MRRWISAVGAYLAGAALGAAGPWMWYWERHTDDPRAQMLREFVGPPGGCITATTLRTFTAADPTITRDVVVDGGAWLAVCTQGQTYRLFEVAQPSVEDCTVLYRARLKTEGLTERAYLEMWCRLPGRGEFFSKGLNQIATGSNDWATYEIPFFLKQGERPDLIRLNLVVEAAGKLFKKAVSGKVWLADVQLVQHVRA